MRRLQAKAWAPHQKNWIYRKAAEVAKGRRENSQKIGAARMSCSPLQGLLRSAFEILCVSVAAFATLR